MRKTTRLPALVLALILLCTGCGILSSILQAAEPKNVIDEALDYLEQKYGISFQYSAPYGDSLSGDKSFHAIAGDLGEEDPVVVKILNYKTEAWTVQDNYYNIKFRDQIRSYLQETAESIWGTAYVLHKTNRVTVQGDLSGNATFEEWLREAKSTIEFNLIVPESAFQDELQIQTYARQLATDGLYYNGHVVVAPDEIAASMDNEAFSDFYASKDCPVRAQVCFWGKMIEYYPCHYGEKVEGQKIWLETSPTPTSTN